MVHARPRLLEFAIDVCCKTPINQCTFNLLNMNNVFQTRARAHTHTPAYEWHTAVFRYNLESAALDGQQQQHKELNCARDMGGHAAAVIRLPN